MSAIQDLEQSILQCNLIVDDLKLVAEHVNNGSDFTSVIHGIAELHYYKLEKLWEEFEAVTKEYYDYRNKALVGVDNELEL